MKETLFEVDGMSCASCIRHINNALCEIPGVEKVDVKLREGTVVVTHDATNASDDSLINALRDAGYESRVKAA
jgi:copper chaperone